MPVFTDKSPTERMAEHGQIWRPRYLWKLPTDPKPRVCKAGEYVTFCRCGRVIRFNKWTPAFNQCLRCYLVSVGSIRAAIDEVRCWKVR